VAGRRAVGARAHPRRRHPAARAGPPPRVGRGPWLDVTRDLPFEGTPVLSDEEFDRAYEEIEAIVEGGVIDRTPALV
jgi:hypothetical protein